MKLFLALSALILTTLSFTGCGHKEGAENGKAKAEGKNKEQGHKEEPPSGASFKSGKGVLLLDETRKLLQVETTEVSEQKLPREVHFTAQVFGEVHAADSPVTEHTQCVMRASGLLSARLVEGFSSGQPVTLVPKGGERLQGSIQHVHPASTPGDAELLLAITNAGTRLQPGDFLAVIAVIPRAESVMVVPRSAILRTSEGTFVYAVNGEAFYRTAVRIGSASSGLVEISDGLLSGDSVVTMPVETLWLIELRATKGGAGCTDGH